MAIPTSGQLRLFYAGKEVVVGDVTAPIPDSTVLSYFPNGISLTEISTGTGAASDDPINTYSVSRPDGSTPHALSEFYGYDDDAGNLPPPAGIYSLTNPIFIADEGFSRATNTANPDPIARSGYDWRLKSFSFNYSASMQVRLIIMYYHDAYNDGAAFFVNSIKIGSSDANHYYPEREDTGNYLTQNSTSVNSPPSTWLAVNQNDGFSPTAPIWGYCNDDYGMFSDLGDQFIIWNPLLEIYQGSATDTELNPYPPAYEPNKAFYVYPSELYDSYNWIRTPAVTLPAGTNVLSFVYATAFYSVYTTTTYRYSYFQVYLEVL